jgi:chorismate dehydratase
MIFGKIEYLNLLPFHVFMKRYTKSSQESQSMQYYKNVPSAVNARFVSRKVDAAFISSIAAKKYEQVGLGIIAKKEVLSVLLLPSSTHKTDKASASSNALADVLGLQGEVMIGDRALEYFYEAKEHIDLAKEWNNRHKLPFVFALLCFHKEKKLYKKIEKKFLKSPVKIPQYLLIKASKRTNISPQNILHYLNYISYDVDAKAQRGLKLFYKLSKS